MYMDNHPIPSNPFYQRTPVRTRPLFFGHQRELNQLYDLVQKGQSVSLVGPRRIGKSSLLLQLTHTHTSLSTALAGLQTTFIYLSCDVWQDCSADVIYAAFGEALTDTLMPVAVGPAVALPNPEMLDYAAFARHLRTVVQRNQRIVFLLDEFDSLSRNRYLDETFFSNLRSLASMQAVVFVTASTVSLLDLTYAQQSALSSPFFNIFLPQRLGLLTEDDAVALLITLAAQGDLALTAPQISFLLDLAGPHPYFLQIAGYHFWEAWQQTGAVDWGWVQREFVDHAFQHWNYQWRYLAVNDQRALALLPATIQEAPTTIQRLAYACLLRKTNGRVDYLSSAFRDFVRQQVIHDVIQAGSLVIDRQRQSVWVENVCIALMPQDYKLLEIFATQLNKVLTHLELEQRLWPAQARNGNQDRLKAAIKSLRTNLGDYAKYIVSERGMGYRFSPNSL